MDRIPPFLDWCPECKEDGYFAKDGMGWRVKCSKCEAETSAGEPYQAAVDWNGGRLVENA